MHMTLRIKGPLLWEYTRGPSDSRYSQTPGISQAPLLYWPAVWKGKEVAIPVPTHQTRGSSMRACLDVF